MFDVFLLCLWDIEKLTFPFRMQIKLKGIL